METFSKAVLNFSLSAVRMILSAILLACLWQWFVFPLAPKVLVPQLTFWWALGLSLFLQWPSYSTRIEKAFEKWKYNHERGLPREDQDPWHDVYAIVTISALLGFAWLFYWCM